MERKPIRFYSEYLPPINEKGNNMDDSPAKSVVSVKSALEVEVSSPGKRRPPPLKTCNSETKQSPFSETKLTLSQINVSSIHRRRENSVISTKLLIDT